MKRNLDLCYLILQKIVDSNEDCCNIYSNIGFSEKEILFNVKLLLNEKFIYGVIEQQFIEENYRQDGVRTLKIKNASLTWIGFDLYDQMTSERTFSVKNGVPKTNFCNEYKALDYFYSNYNRQ